MKTFFILPDLFRAEGGIARIMRLYVRAAAEIAAPGDRVSYAALLDSGDTRERARTLVGAALDDVSNAGGSRLRFFAAGFAGALRSDRVICGHIFHLVIVRLAKLLRPSLPYYLVAHGIDVWRPYRWHELWALRGARRIFCISDYTRRQMLRFAPSLPPEKLVVVPNTFDPNFSATATRTPSRDAPALLVVSRLTHNDRYKGVDLVIEAMPRVRREFPQAKLRIVGTGDDLPRLRSLVQRLRLNDAVFFTGLIDDAALRREYAECDIFALPSRKEGFGLVYLEAMAYGKPCIAARAGGAPEVVGDRDESADGNYQPGSTGSTEVGALVDFGNFDEIARAVSDLILHPRDPATIRARAAAYGFAAFTQKLRVALGQP